MSRLAFGPEADKMEVTDIATGHFVFKPVKDKRVSYALLEEAIKDAGYEIERASIVTSGTLTDNRHLRTPEGQTFHLTAESGELRERLSRLEPQAALSVQGTWESREGSETIVVREILEAPGSATPGAAR